MLADRHTALGEGVADGRAEDVHRGELAVDVEVDGLVEASGAETGEGDGCDGTDSGGTADKTADHNAPNVGRPGRARDAVSGEGTSQVGRVLRLRALSPGPDTAPGKGWCLPAI